MHRLSLAVTMVLAICWASSGLAETGTATSVPIQIEADRMETSQEESVVIFSGHVKANQGVLTINADEMTVSYIRAETDPAATDPENVQGLPQKIAQIMAAGNVKIVQGDWIAAGDAMDFNAEKRIVILSGNAKAWQNQNMVTGEKIILYLDEGRSVVERSSAEGERVKAFIYPSAQEEKDKNNP